MENLQCLLPGAAPVPIAHWGGFRGAGGSAFWWALENMTELSIPLPRQQVLLVTVSIHPVMSKQIIIFI